MRPDARRALSGLVLLTAAGLLAGCDTTNQLAPSLPRVVGLQVDGAQLQILTGTPCDGVDEIALIFSGDGDTDSLRTQLAADAAHTVDRLRVGTGVVVDGFTTTEALPAGFDWRDYSEMDVILDGPAGAVGESTSDLEPVKADGVKHSGDGTAYVRREGWLTLPEIIDGNTKSFLTACTPDPADKQ
ncbi:hypothetical protein [Aeromicrobium wangtongii]|uniref:Lipoprotein n=1 Tax=Aeromicrobium wangtongii TaxID=2969247 RepID=A0ABY5M5N6_9ACTN|nr:hypothetical protein [Aeromicrobium wangtongii]MCD9199851.1 hypothetical protein [Aeromicrobium wangtongii]UUP13470.1 hypothetical protein NQV15_16715 [Aeromicrobium wangtongii]